MTSIADVTGKSIAELVSLSGRTAVVTGGGQGLGKAIAKRLAEAGANVVVGDIKEDLATAAGEDLDTVGSGNAIGTFMDVSDSASIKAAAQLACDRFGGIDIWVNNAGIFPSVVVSEMTDELWDQVLAVNGRGVFAGSREAAKTPRPLTART